MLAFLSLRSQNMYVYLGEYKSDPLCVRFDGDGELYPDYNVPIDKGCNIGSSDRSFVNYMYDKDCPMRSEILKAYNLSPTLTFEQIQKEIVKKKIEQINLELKNQSIDNVTFLMVGFNNHYSITGSADCANVKLTALRKKISDVLALSHKRTLFVDVYWDGTESEKEGLYTALHLSNAGVNSFWVGLGLREIINGLACDTVQMISHSLGANIITESIFNQNSKISSNRFKRELKEYRDIIPIPTKTFSVGLIAPAIPGVSTFIDYLNSSKSNNTNCTFVIGYNTNDLSLNKQFLFFPKNPKHFSSTSLGCVRAEVEEVENMFKNDYPKMGTFKKIDFSIYNGTPQYIHDLEAYMLEPQYVEMLKQVYNIH